MVVHANIFILLVKLNRKLLSLFFILEVILKDVGINESDSTLLYLNLVLVTLDLGLVGQLAPFGVFTFILNHLQLSPMIWAWPDCPVTPSIMSSTPDFVLSAGAGLMLTGKEPPCWTGLPHLDW